MSEPSWKSSQPLASDPGPRMALVGAGEPSEVPTPKTPRARQRGAKHKSAAKTRNPATAPGRKPRSKPPKKLEKEEEEGILEESRESTGAALRYFQSHSAHHS
uniref:High mobility group protein HMG-I/HMG-Y n=1 Tax=Ursus maritimus TaxID=29073 RepID=A0A452UBR7_URSMA